MLSWLRSSQRIGARDVGRRERRRRDLIEQRLEDVVVRAIDQRDVHRRTLERARRVQSAEAAADDDHARPATLEHPGLRDAGCGVRGCGGHGRAGQLRKLRAQAGVQRRDRVQEDAGHLARTDRREVRVVRDAGGIVRIHAGFN